MVKYVVRGILSQNYETFKRGNGRNFKRKQKSLHPFEVQLRFMSKLPKPIVSAACIGKAYCGVLRNDVRLLFIVKLSDGSVQLIQSKEGSSDCRKLFEYM